MLTENVRYLIGIVMSRFKGCQSNLLLGANRERHLPLVNNV